MDILIKQNMLRNYRSQQKLVGMLQRDQQSAYWQFLILAYPQYQNFFKVQLPENTWKKDWLHLKDISRREEKVVIIVIMSSSLSFCCHAMAGMVAMPHV